MQCKPNNHPANSLRHAYSRYEYVCANLLEGEKLAALCLFVMTMPIQKAVASGNGNIEFYRETTRSNLK
jgi:hypothetical protein